MIGLLLALQNYMLKYHLEYFYFSKLKITMDIITEMQNKCTLPFDNFFMGHPDPFCIQFNVKKTGPCSAEISNCLCNQWNQYHSCCTMQGYQLNQTCLSKRVSFLRNSALSFLWRKQFFIEVPKAVHRNVPSKEQYYSNVYSVLT